MSTEPTQADLDAFLVRAGFHHGWKNLESVARSMVRHAVREQERLVDALYDALPYVTDVLDNPDQLACFKTGVAEVHEKEIRDAILSVKGKL